MATVEARRQELSRLTAHRHGAPWTRAEAEIAMRTDLTIEQRAVMLGRTRAAVKGWLRTYRRRPDDPYSVKSN